MSRKSKHLENLGQIQLSKVENKFRIEDNRITCIISLKTPSMKTELDRRCLAAMV